MAKRHNDLGGTQPARVRYFELEGSDETIQKALSTFERMRNPGSAAQQSPKRIESAAKGSPEPTLFDEDNVVDGEEVAGEDEATREPAAGQRRKRGDGAPIDRNAGITAAGDVDFYPKGKASLKEFFADKAPGSDMERCLVFCFYLQEEAALSPFGVRHVLAGFNTVEKEIPKDLPATLRNMREGKKGGKAWLAFDDLENIRVTTNGLNHVRHKLGKTGAEKE